MDTSSSVSLYRHKIRRWEEIFIPFFYLFIHFVPFGLGFKIIDIKW